LPFGLSQVNLNNNNTFFLLLSVYLSITEIIVFVNIFESYFPF